jgi:hypothetical protein
MSGHIRKRDYGGGRVRWRARYPNPSRLPGKSAKIERTFATKREAEVWLTEQRSALNRGTHIDPADGKLTFADVDHTRSTQREQNRPDLACPGVVGVGRTRWLRTRPCAWSVRARRLVAAGAGGPGF